MPGKIILFSAEKHSDLEAFFGTTKVSNSILRIVDDLNMIKTKPDLQNFVLRKFSFTINDILTKTFNMNFENAGNPAFTKAFGYRVTNSELDKIVKYSEKKCKDIEIKRSSNFEYTQSLINELSGNSENNIPEKPIKPLKLTQQPPTNEVISKVVKPAVKVASPITTVPRVYHQEFKPAEKLKTIIDVLEKLEAEITNRIRDMSVTGMDYLKSISLAEVRYTKNKHLNEDAIIFKLKIGNEGKTFGAYKFNNSEPRQIRQDLIGFLEKHAISYDSKNINISDIIANKDFGRK